MTAPSKRLQQLDADCNSMALIIDQNMIELQEKLCEAGRIQHADGINALREAVNNIVYTDVGDNRVRKA